MVSFSSVFLSRHSVRTDLKKLAVILVFTMESKGGLEWEMYEIS